MLGLAMRQRYKLYGWKLTGSFAIEAALAEAGVDHEFVPVSRKTDETWEKPSPASIRASSCLR